MYVHLALFRWKEGTEEDKVNLLLAGVKSLKDVVPGIMDIFAGKNTHSEGKGFSHAIVVVANGEGAVTEYRNHPAHKELAEQIEAIEEDGLGCDFQDLNVLF